jgi:hypothetical protein
MTIHEQITALLNGELTDTGQVSELLHVLAVSPEKRDLLVEQVRMSRGFAAMGGSIAPPPSADAKILSGLAAIDAEFPSAGPATAVAPSAPVAPGVVGPAVGGLMSSLLFRSLAALLLVGLGLGIGYMAGTTSDSDAVATMQAKLRDASAASALLRDSLRGERAEVASLRSGEAATTAMIDSLRTAASAAPRIREVVRYVHVAASKNTDVQPSRNVEQPAVTPQEWQPTSTATIAQATEIRPAQIEVPRVVVEQARVPVVMPSLRSGTPAQDAGQARRARRIQAGFRNNMVRVSLPKVYGLNASDNALTDNEVFGTYSLSEDGGVKIGAAGGRTRIGLIIHSNTGGMPVDTITELNPELMYGRAFLSSEVLAIPNWNTSLALELGIGGTKIGPMGTFGVNAEVELLDRLSLQFGTSSWLLLATYQGRMQSSVNFNLHLGASIGLF